MKNKIPQILVIVALVIVISIGLPSSFAKYSGTKTYNVKISKKTVFQKVAYASSTAYGDSPTTSLLVGKSGYYAIIAKGGSGSTGMRVKSSLASKWVDDYYSGGQGGIVAGYIYVDSGTNIYACAGSTGKKGALDEPGSGGTNAWNFGKGGSGNDLGGLSIAASGGGGAASVISINTNSATTLSNVLIIAGGGGSAGCNDVGYLSSIDAGEGGSGGSNYNPSTGTTLGSGPVYNGSNGTTSNGKDNYGHGGTSSGGTSSGNAGSSYANSGNGGSTIGTSLAGAGGGGYCGGGGGTGSGNSKKSSGGGGGGSSYMSSSVTVINKSLFDYAISKTDGKCSASQLGGFVVIVYLGDTPTVPAS